MRQASSKALFDYWNALRGARSAPERAKIDPAAIRDVMPDTFMLEVDPAAGFPVRMSGTRMDALLGQAQNGRRFLDLWPKADAHAVAAMLLTVADGVCPIVAGAAAHAADYLPLDLEIMLLPLRQSGRAQGRILGSMVPVTRPRWLGLVAAQDLRVHSFRVIDADAIPRQTPTPRAPARPRGHLHVYDGGLSA